MKAKTLPTEKQLDYLGKIVSQIDGWAESPPQTKQEASDQIDKAKELWAIEHSGDTAEIY